MFEEVSNVSDPGSPICVDDLSTSLLDSNLYVFTLAELRSLTHDFAYCYSGLCAFQTGINAKLFVYSYGTVLHVFTRFYASSLLCIAAPNELKSCDFNDFNFSKDVFVLEASLSPETIKRST
ncbi:hypothetical protein V6N12_021526 [Hibiscus sabdariffa]|uniref:Uncharacterized protein n=1 Tax=Hibiscus sabdariffa TaxID=183260 RepID=A0ABR2FS17_9ROSI